MEKTRARRTVVVVDNRPLAQRIGSRIRNARQAAGLTQRQLAAGRFTGAYISALEKGIAKPSMASLAFISERLGVAIRHFLDDAQPAWTRLEADVLLASGDWQQAVDAYRALLDDVDETRARAELLRGIAEALCRLERGGEAIRPASEAEQLFASLRRETDRVAAGYWHAFAQYQVGNVAEARSILRDVLDRLRGGLEVQADFKVRVLTALSMVESWDGNADGALAYMEEARSLADEFDDRRRARFLFALAQSYQAAGDLEAAIRAATQSLALFQATDAQAEIASLDNRLAVIHLRLGNTERSGALAATARSLAERAHNDRLLAHIADTQARVALARGNHDEAHRLVDEAIAAAERVGSLPALTDAYATRAQIQVARGEPEEASRSFERAAEILREHGPRGRLKQVLGEWAELMSSVGDHQRANQLYREALTPTR